MDDRINAESLSVESANIARTEALRRTRSQALTWCTTLALSTDSSATLSSAMASVAHQ
jgi:hypothetical protein